MRIWRRPAGNLGAPPGAATSHAEPRISRSQIESFCRVSPGAVRALLSGKRRGCNLVLKVIVARGVVANDLGDRTTPIARTDDGDALLHFWVAKASGHCRSSAGSGCSAVEAVRPLPATLFEGFSLAVLLTFAARTSDVGGAGDAQAWDRDGRGAEGVW